MAFHKKPFPSYCTKVSLKPIQANEFRKKKVVVIYLQPLQMSFYLNNEMENLVNLYSGCQFQY